MNRRAFLLSAVSAAVATPVLADTDAAFSGSERAAVAAILGLGEQVFALDDATLEARVLAYAIKETGQRVRPDRIDSLWAISPALRDLNGELERARGSGRLGAWLAGLSPEGDGYRRLAAERGRYAAIVNAGGWHYPSNGPVLRPGDIHSDIVALRTRLDAEGHGETPGAADHFDPALEGIVRIYQARHGLEADGVVGPATRAALSAPASDRLSQIDANLERWRWLPPRLPPDRIEVDTGAQDAVLYRSGAEALRMRVVVGSPVHPTPMLASHIDAVVLNPPWNVPASIARNELLPAEARQPGRLASMGIRWVDGHLQQKPGPGNSLGLIKFDIQSRFGVYLHDTPAKPLFARPVRAFSHGCIRLQEPRALALALLAAQGVSASEVDAIIAVGATKRIALEERLALYIVHRTAIVEPDGSVSFRPDIYGWDRKLSAALPAPAFAPAQSPLRAVGQGSRHV